MHKRLIIQDSTYLRIMIHVITCDVLHKLHYNWIRWHMENCREACVPTSIASLFLVYKNQPYHLLSSSICIGSFSGISVLSTFSNAFYMKIAPHVAFRQTKYRFSHWFQNIQQTVAMIVRCNVFYKLKFIQHPPNKVMLLILKVKILVFFNLTFCLNNLVH